MSELLSCPFCGAPGVRTLVGHADIQYFHCDERTQGCGAVISFLPRKIGSSAFAAWSRRASPSVGGVRVPDALSEHPRSSSYDQGWADGFTHCRSEVLRLNPAAEVGVMVGNVPIAAKIMSFLQIEPGVCLDDAGINPANLARAITLANTYKDARDEIDQHKAPENRTNDTDAYEPLPHSAASPDRERR